MNTLLHLICANGAVGEARLLIGLKSEHDLVLRKTAITEATALHFAVLGSHQEGGRHADVVSALLETEVDLFARNSGEHTALSLLADTSDRADIAAVLIGKMMSIDSKSKVYC